jgi:hypothetical protein
LKTALQESEGRNIYCNTSLFGANYRGQSFIAAVIQIPDLPPVKGRNKDGGPNLWALQTAPAVVRNLLTVSGL